MRRCIYSIIVLTIISFINSGDLVKCMKDCSTIVGEAALLVKDISEKAGLVQIAKDIIAITQTINNLIDDCDNPIPLNKAYERCIAEHSDTGCEKWGAIIYPKCKKGFYNVECCICSHFCPPGFRDDGLYCSKPEAYGRGAGYPWEFRDDLSLQAAMKRCQADYPELGCEQWGLVIYPKCKEGFHNVGCCVCSPNCPEGWNDIGVSCQKPSNYGRGVGYPWHSGDGESKFLPILPSYNNIKLKENCPPEYLEELQVANIEIIQNKEDINKLYQSIYKAAGIISKLQGNCDLPTV